MDLIAMRFEARHLEVEGKLQEALDICREILRHHAHEPPTEQILPVFVQASEISIKLGDRDGGATLLLLAAERYADAGLARPVIELYQRLRRLGPGRRGLDLQFARRMLEHRHPTAAREFLTDLARRQKKEKLLVTLERMAAWQDDKVQHMLLEFLDRAQGIRVSVAEPQASPPAGPPPSSEATTEVRPPAAPPPARDPAQEATAVRPAVRPPAAAPSDAVTERRPAAQAPPPPSPEPPSIPQATAPPPERVTGPRRGIRAEPDTPAPIPDRAPTPPPPRASGPRDGEVMAADAVVFVSPGAPEPPEPRVSPRATRAPIVPPPRRRKRPALRWAIMGVTGAAVLAVGAVYLVPRLRRSPPAAVVIPSATPVAAVPAAPAPAPAESSAVRTAPDSLPGGVLAPADTVSVAVVPPAAAAVTPTPSAPAPALRREEPPPARAVPPTAPPVRTPPVTQPDRPPADTTRVAAAAPPREPVRAPPPVPVAGAPPPSAPPADYPVVVVDGLEIVEITREGDAAALRIVVKQLLPSGDTLDLRESDLGEGSVTVGAGRLLVRRHPAGGSMGTVRVGRFLVNARAPVGPEVLEPLLRTLVERN